MPRDLRNLRKLLRRRARHLKLSRSVILLQTLIACVITMASHTSRLRCQLPR